MRRTRLAWILLALSLSACTSGGPGSGPAADAAAPAVVGAGDELPPEQLLEAPPRTDNERLLRQAQQNRQFCVVMSSLDALEEPRPNDLEESLKYAQAYYNIIYTLDPRSRVNDPEATGGRRRMSLPAQIFGAAEENRKHMFAYVRRLQWLQLQLDEGKIERDAVGSRLDDAFLRLTLSGYTTTDRALTEFAQRACVS